MDLYFVPLAVSTNLDASLQKTPSSANVARFEVSNDRCAGYLSLTNIICDIYDTLNLYIIIYDWPLGLMRTGLARKVQ